MIDFTNWYQETYLNPSSPKSLRGSQVTPQSQDDDLQDVLDYQEKFDLMVMEKIIREDPDSLHFYNARKNINKKSLSAKKVPSNLPLIAKKGKKIPFK